MANRDPLENPQPLVRRVYSYVAYRIGDGADAEDVTSTTFERALRYRHTFDERKGDPAAWLVGIAARCVSEYFAGKPVLADESQAEGVAAAGDLPADAASRIDLQRAVAQLGERDRELVALRFGADLTARQIGELLGMRTNAVEVGLHRLLDRLRDLLDQPERHMPAAGREQRVRASE